MHQESTLLLFSQGPRNCAGKLLVQRDLRMIFCALLQRFRFRFAEGWDAREHEKG
ncbi:hypothetical protein C8T65DRAFT_676537 [Cerioporus squamosus]|nr:hypothetical protein C8T65DRAFT_676537 [Cerioporus squamosus]